MGKSYRHLDYTERALIYWWRKEQLSLRAIARRLQRSHASISRELKRHLWCGLHYYPRGAQILYTYRLERRVQRDRLKSQSVRESVHQKLHLGWTPELIAGRLKFHSHLPSVCHESIYQYIYGVAPDLIASLPRYHPKRKPKRPYRKTGERIKYRPAWRGALRRRPRERSVGIGKRICLWRGTARMD